MPVRIDPFRLARERRVLEGELPLDPMQRLAPSLRVVEGTVSVRLAFDYDAAGVPSVRGRIQTCLQLVCQRCMEPLHLPLRLELAYALVESEAEMEILPAEYEPLVVGSEPLFLSDLVEDELILALPIVPRHSECPVEVEKTVPERQDEDAPKTANPFAVLAELKQSRDN